jgi:magnesium chelatase family protein
LQVSAVGRFPLMGELGLDGGERPVPCSLPVPILAPEKNITNLILPAANAAEAAIVAGVKVILPGRCST